MVQGDDLIFEIFMKIVYGAGIIFISLFIGYEIDLRRSRSKDKNLIEGLDIEDDEEEKNENITDKKDLDNSSYEYNPEYYTEENNYENNYDYDENYNDNFLDEFFEFTLTDDDDSRDYDYPIGTKNIDWTEDGPDKKMFY